MGTTKLQSWVPTEDEVRKILAELRPVIDACEARSWASQLAATEELAAQG
jgi:hypothetical protein